MSVTLILSLIVAGIVALIGGIFWLVPAGLQGIVFGVIAALGSISGVALMAWGIKSDGVEQYAALALVVVGVIIVALAIIFIGLAWWRW